MGILDDVTQKIGGLFSDPVEPHPPVEARAAHVIATPKFATPSEARAYAKDVFGVNLEFDPQDERDWGDVGTAPKPKDKWDARSATNSRAAMMNDFRTVAATLQRAKEQGVVMPKTVRVSYDDKDFSFGTMAYYNHPKNLISINRGWMHDTGQEDPPSTVMHELGHRQFNDFFWQDQHSPEEKQIAEKVSPYAATGRGEFLAELYSKAALGKPVDPAAMDYYARLKGPPLPKLLPPPFDPSTAKQHFAGGGTVAPDGSTTEFPVAPVAPGPTSIEFVLGPDGSVIPVDAAVAPQLLASGRFGVPNGEQIRHAKLQAQYGGFGSQAMTAAEGLASGLTLGTSRYLERMTGVQGVAERAEANPDTNLIADLAGTAIPLVATFGASAGSTAAKLAAKTGPGLVARARRAVTGAAAEALGPGESIAAQIARRAIASGAGGAVEGAAYGLGNAVDESALGDPHISAQHLFASAGLGALVGGGLGATLGFAESASPFLLGKAKGALESAYGNAKDIIAKHIGASLPAAETVLTNTATSDVLRSELGPEFIERLVRAEPGTAETIIKNAPRFTQLAKAIPGFAEHAAEADPQMVEWAISRADPLIMAEKIQPGITNKLIKAEPSVAEELLTHLDGIYSPDRAIRAKTISQVTRRVYKSAQDVVSTTDRAFVQFYSDIFPKLKAPIESMGGADVQKFFSNPGWQEFLKNMEGTLQSAETAPGELSRPFLAELETIKGKIGKLTASYDEPAGKWFREWYDNLLQTRSDLGTLSRFNPDGVGRPSPTVKRTQGVVRQLYTQLADMVKDPAIFGDTASTLASIDQVKAEWEALFNKGRGSPTFRDLFSSGAGKTISPAKISSFVKNITSDGGIDQAEAYHHMLRTASKVLGTVEELSSHLPTSRFDSAAAQDLIERAAASQGEALQRARLTDAFNALPKPALNPLAPTEGMDTSTIAAAAWVADKIFPGHGKLLSALAAGAKAADYMKNPSNAVKTLAAIERVSKEVSKKIATYSTSLVRGWERGSKVAQGEALAGVSREFAAEPESAAKTGMKRMTLVRSLASDPASMYEVLGQQQDVLGTHAPQIAMALNATTTSAVTYLAAHAPQPPERGILTTDWVPNRAEVASFNRRWEAVNDPTSILRQAAAGTITPEAIDAVRTVHPQLFGAMQAALVDALSSHGKVPSYRNRMMIGAILGQDIDGSLTPHALIALQAAYMAPTNRGPGSQAMPPIDAMMMARPSKQGMSEIKTHQRMMTPLQKAGSREQTRF